MTIPSIEQREARGISSGIGQFGNQNCIKLHYSNFEFVACEIRGFGNEVNLPKSRGTQHHGPKFSWSETKLMRPEMDDFNGLQ